MYDGSSGRRDMGSSVRNGDSRAARCEESRTEKRAPGGSAESPCADVSRLAIRSARQAVSSCKRCSARYTFERHIPGLRLISRVGYSTFDRMNLLCSGENTLVSSHVSGEAAMTTSRVHAAANQNRRSYIAAYDTGISYMCLVWAKIYSCLA